MSPLKSNDDDDDESFFDGPLLFSLMAKTAIFEDAADSDYPEKDEATVTLKDVYFANGTYRADRAVQYEYDHGDGWTHDIVFLGTAPPDFRAAMHVPDILPVFCVSGEGHSCAEDCGGPRGGRKSKMRFVSRRAAAGVSVGIGTRTDVQTVTRRA